MKHFFTILSLIVILSSNAQTKIALKGGYNYSTGRVIYKSIKQPVEAVHGFGLGVLFKAEFDGVLHFSPYVQLNSRGFVIKPLTGTYKRIENTIQYLDIVPALSLDFKSGKNAVVISFAPTASITNFGKEKKTDANNVTTTSKITFGYNNIGWFDLGATASIGYHLKKVFFEAGYYRGLANINNNVEFDANELHHRMLSFNIGYYIK